MSSLVPVSKTIFIANTGLSFSGLFFGNTKNPPILSIHGWQDNAASFIPLGRLLGEEFAVWSFDLSGHGKSDHIGLGASYNFLDWGLSILHMANYLGIDKIRSVSHSMGAALMGLMASMFPDRFDKLCLVEALFPFSHDLDYYAKKAEKRYQSQLKTWPQKEIKSVEDAAKLRQAAGDMSREHAMFIAERNLMPHPQNNAAYTWSFDPRIKFPMGSFTHEQFAYHLEKLNTPTLVLKGTQGAPFVTEQLERAKQKNKTNIQSATIEGGHHIHMDNAEGTAVLIRNFFKE